MKLELLILMYIFHKMRNSIAIPVHNKSRYCYHLKNMLILITLIQLFSCKADTSGETTQLVYMHNTKFLTEKGSVTFLGMKKIWQKDSVFIQCVYTSVSSSVDGIQGATAYEPLLYRYMDIRSKFYFDYYHFSDTAVCFRTGKLASELITDNTHNLTINLANESRFPIKSMPVVLGDTIIDNERFKKIRFNTLYSDTSRTYCIGLIKTGCTNYFKSKESYYSKQLGGCLVCIWEYYDNNTYPSVRSDYEDVADTLSAEELKVFAAWERNAKNYKSP
jgi:hypothetical protein